MAVNDDENLFPYPHSHRNKAVFVRIGFVIGDRDCVIVIKN